MIFVITNRQVVYEAHKLRWVNTGFWATSLESYGRGVSKNKLKTALEARQFWHKGLLGFLVGIHTKIRPRYMGSFTPKLEDSIQRCIEENYLRPVEEMGDTKLFVTEIGRKFISPLYFPKLFFGNAIVKAVIISAITLITTGYIADNIIHRVSNAIVDSNERQP